jgi:citrate synthase
LPNGKEVDLPVREGTLGSPMIDVALLYSKTGYLTIDPGYNSTGAYLNFNLTPLVV